MSGTNLEDTILKAIDIIVSKKVSEAGYDKTIQGMVAACADPTIGKYKIRYQDSYFYAFATNMDVTYNKGSSVYILVPKGDFRQQKTILGAVNKLGINYIAVAERDQAYIYSGQNCIKDNGKQIAISSYLKNLSNQSKYLKIIYSYNGGSKNLINIDTTRFQEYIKTSSSLICGSTIRTSFNAEQKERGNYGLIFRLSFKDNNTGGSIIRSYLLDINKMTGNPYNYINAVRQYTIFNDVDGKNFIRIEDISLFCYGFPNQTITESTIKNDLLDIFFSKLELIACNKMADQELSTYGLILQPSKIVFVNDQDAAEKTIQAEVRIKGKTAEAAQDIKYYWFVEDSSVVTDSPFYCQYGGRGWQCLNEKNILQKEIKNSTGVIIKPAVYEWQPADSKLSIKNADILAKSIKYKCVAIYDDTNIAKEFEVKKLTGIDLSIVSDSGTEFYYDLGSPTLTCLVNGKEDIKNYVYEWSVSKADGDFDKVIEDVNKDAYNKLLDKLEKTIQLKQNLKENLAANKILKTSGEQQLQKLEQEIEAQEKQIEKLATSVMTVYKNQIIHVAISSIVNYNIYKCAVWTVKNNKYIGTASLQIRNILDKKQGYLLVINDGVQSFKYNEKGVAPTSTSLTNPYILKPLSFTIYDEFGREAISSSSTDEKILKQQLTSIEWKIPSINSMLLPPSTGTIKDDNYIFNSKTLNYKIKSSYNISCKQNNISLVVNYKNNILKAQTNFTFVKEGQPGTNGTAYTCKIEPYVKSGTNIPFYPTIYLDLQNTEYKFKDDDNHFNFACTKHNGQWFRVKFFHNDELIYSSDGTKNNSQVSIKWSIVANKYNSSYKDNAALTVNQSTGIFSVNTAAFKEKQAPACTIKAEVTYNGITEYAYLPVIFSINRANYKIDLNEYTGFNLAIYTGDGRKPSYDNASPHTLTVRQKINNVNEDITNNNQNQYKLTYNWSLLGSSCWTNPTDAINAIQKNKNLSTKEKKQQLEALKVKNYGSKLIWNNNATLLKKTGGGTNNQFSCQPIDDFSNLCVTNSVKCIVTQGTNQIGFIIMPVHMMLNQYGNAKINGWDGNSVDIDDDGGVILSPQVGAGRKESDNTFTGVLIGEVKQNDSGLSKTYNGLLGFSKGRRSIYLDADTGRAYFGVAGQGQIELIPDGDSTIGGWVIGQTTLHSKGKEKFGDNKVGGLLQNSGKIDFTSDKGNFLRYDGTNFYLNGGTITGGSIDIGSSFFTADAERIDFGSFMITESYGRDALTVEGNSMAISANVYETGGWWLWFSLYGNDVGEGDDDPSDYAMVLNEGGQLYAQDFLYINGGAVSVKSQINSIWSQIWALWEAVESMDEEEED